MKDLLDKTAHRKWRKCLGCALSAESHTPHFHEKKLNESGEDRIRKPLILLVEDERVTQFIHKRMLLKLACDVDIAANCKDTLEMLDTNDYDLIFLDIGLPDMWGVEIARAIHQRLKSKPQTRIIVLTGHMEDDLKRECMAAGVEKVLHKPVDIDNLRHVIYT
jgi:CheY-like chemotaxis protein